MRPITSDFYGKEEAEVRRVDELTEKFMRLCQEAGETPLDCDPEWGEFRQLAPSSLRSDLLVGWIKNRRENVVKALVAECTAPLPPERGYAELGARTNRLLGAILLKLHGIDA